MLLYFLALFLPPVPVFLKKGCGADFLINIGLSILGWIPGVLRKLLVLCWVKDMNLIDVQILGGSYRGLSATRQRLWPFLWRKDGVELSDVGKPFNDVLEF